MREGESRSGLRPRDVGSQVQFVAHAGPHDLPHRQGGGACQTVEGSPVQSDAIQVPAAGPQWPGPFPSLYLPPGPGDGGVHTQLIA